MSKQTAVEWFYQRILAKDIKEVFEQAKQMEKEQIEDAYLTGSANKMNDEGSLQEYIKEKL
jgi:hemoglobin-like flavoprotein